MGVPLQVATATSNLMIGITASVSALIYLVHGEIDPYLAGPTAIGVFLGATLGSRIADRVDARVLRLLFVAILGYTAIQMLLQGARVTSGTRDADAARARRRGRPSAGSSSG